MRKRTSQAFTLVELLIVIVVISLLAALLLPAIGSAVRRANEAAVQAEISLMQQALADFKGKYGDYPPSRILICEDGGYGIMSSSTSYGYTGANDISDQDLARRSLMYLRKFFPRVTFSTVPSVPVFSAPFTPGVWYDCNGSGGNAPDPPYVLTGDECLYFFLGGIPQASTPPNGVTTWSATGFSANRLNPFTLTGKNRVAPLFEFRPGRLVDLDKDGIPSVFDPLGTKKPYAYFSAYGGSGYDCNDVNFPEDDDSGTVNPITLKFKLSFPVGGSTTNITTSPGPNPYTVTPTTANSVAWQSPNSYQIISSGYDGLYGVGGVYATNSNDPLPVDSANSTPGNDSLIRVRERDAITSFKGGRLD